MKYALNYKRVIAAAFLAFSVAGAHAGCYDCSPQCVPSARNWSGIDVPRVSYAIDIIAASRKNAKFKVHSEPKGRSLGVIALGKVGHALAVLDSKKDGKDRKKLVIAHSNADCKCTAERVTAVYSKGVLTFSSGILKGKSYKTLGFVTYS